MPTTTKPTRTKVELSKTFRPAPDSAPSPTSTTAPTFKPSSPTQHAAIREEQFQEHQLLLQEKYARLAAQEKSTHQHDLLNDGSYINAQGQIDRPTMSPCFDATPQYGLRDFELLDTI
ncbi:hypothetical protein BGZ89_007577, partial [Linnemannia elongata]